MCHFSPAVSLLWAVNSTLVRPRFLVLFALLIRFLQFLGYLVWHLWQYDRYVALLSCLWLVLEDERATRLQIQLPQVEFGAAARLVQALHDGARLYPSSVHPCRLTCYPSDPQYSYLATLPLLVIYTISIAVIKYGQGTLSILYPLLTPSLSWTARPLPPWHADR